MSIEIIDTYVLIIKVSKFPDCGDCISSSKSFNLLSTIFRSTKEDMMENKNIGENNSLKEKSYILFKYVITIVMMFMVIVIFANATMRYVLNTGFAASEELARFAFVWISFLGMTIAFFKGKHAGVDFLANAFRGRKRFVFDQITNIFIFVALIAMLYGSVLYLEDTWSLTSPATGIQYGFVYVSALIGTVLMILKLFSIIKHQYTAYKQDKLKRGDK